MRSVLDRVAAGFVLTIAGCPADAPVLQETSTTTAATGSGDADTSGLTTTSESTTGADGTSESSTSGADTSGSSGLATSSDGSTGDASGCSSVDVLLVLDASGSMGEKQAKLHAALPSFADSLERKLGTDDIQWLVTDVDPWFFGECDESCTTAQDAGCLAAGNECTVSGACLLPCQILSLCETQSEPPFACGETVPLECEDVLGAGIVHPQGAGSANTDCGLGDARWLASSDPEFAARFACVSQVGSGSWSNFEQPIGAILAALSTEGEVAACNQGFRREGAALVVVFATDEDDVDPDGSPGDPASWHADLLALEDLDRVVVGGLFGDTERPGSPCAPLGEGGSEGNAADHGVRLQAFMGLLGDSAVFGSICAPSYEEFFVAVADRAAEVCVAR